MVLTDRNVPKNSTNVFIYDYLRLMDAAVYQQIISAFTQIRSHNICGGRDSLDLFLLIKKYRSWGKTQLRYKLMEEESVECLNFFRLSPLKLDQ